MRFLTYLNEAAKKVTMSRFPKIGWWLDHDPVTFYHGTHEKHVKSIIKTGLRAPSEGSTAGWVSLAIEPNTGHGYAAMSGEGGESGFRNAGKKAVNVPHSERATLIIQIPQSDFMKKMAAERGAMQSTKNRLKDKEEYDRLVTNGRMSDVEYYALTEIRYPLIVPAKYIKAYAYLRP